MTAPRKRRAAPAPPAQLPVFTVRSLEQARVLADPLRLRILLEFVAAPRTTKQVAERLGEPAPKLYRHVESLVNAGLLARGEERQKRGTTERYLRAVASRFEVDPSLFAPATESGKATVSRSMVKMVGSVFGDTQREFLAQQHQFADEVDGPILLRIRARGSRDGLRTLRARLVEWVEECQSTAGGDATGEAEYAGLIAFYPTK